VPLRVVRCCLVSALVCTADLYRRGTRPP
jgi:hypothetical protein